MENKSMKKSAVSLFIVFLGTLIVITMARAIAGTNSYIYILLPFIWFLILFFREIKTKKVLLTDEWKLFKQKKWRNSLFVIIIVIVLNLTIQFTRPFFNQFLPAEELTSYNFSSDTVIGLSFTVLVGAINILVAFIEEIAYRYDGMYVFKSKKWLCIGMLIISSILFGFSHYYNFNGSFLATGPYIVAGLILGISYLWSKNIWIPILGHVLFNSMDLMASLLLVIVKIIAN